MFTAGKLAFVVGGSGSGKSTVGNLLLKFYRPVNGRILLDNYPLESLDDRWVRENITLVQQASTLFNETFRNNIAVGHKYPGEVTAQEIKAACDAALLQATISSLPNGLETEIGPSGVSLSGGQTQRLALARARIRDTPVLILDEVTSGLDPVSKVLVMDAIRDWRRGKTTIIITHDISQILDEDFVYVMDKSQLIQAGLKKELMEIQDGPFTTPAVKVKNSGSNLLSASNVSAEQPALQQLASESSPVEYQPRKTSILSQYLIRDLETNARRPEGRRLNRATFGMSTLYSANREGRTGWGNGVRADEELHRLEAAEYIKRSMSTRFNVTNQSRSLPDVSNIASSRSSLDLVNAVGAAVRDARFTSESSYRNRHHITSQNEPANNTQRGNDNKSSSYNENGVIAASGSEMSLREIFKTVLPALGLKEKFLLLIGLILAALAAGLNPAFSYCFAQLLVAFFAPENRVMAGQKWAVLLIIIALVDGFSTYLKHYILEYSGQAWVNSLRAEALKRILRQPKSWFDKPKHAPGRIVECMDRDAEEMRNLVGRFAPIVITVTFMILSAIVWALVISWKLTLVALSGGPMVIAVVKGFSVVSGRWETSCNNAAKDTSAIFAEVFTNIRVVKAFTLESHFASKYNRSARTTWKMGLRRAAYTSPLFGLYQSMNFFLTGLVFYYGTVLLTQKKEASVSTMLEVINLLLFSMGTAAGILGSIPQISAARSTAQQLLYYTNLGSTRPMAVGSGAKKLTTPLPIRMKNLEFAHPAKPGFPVLRNVSLRIDIATCVAIVGPSGCGKSTIASLLLGLHQPGMSTFGAPHPLTFSGVPISDVDMQHLRSMIAYVPQAPFMFPATIAENITYGLPEWSPLRKKQNILAAAIAAGIHEFIISLPDGYHTLVGDGGQCLSGGETQRICIARALVRHPRLIVMDEPTSALDSESADLVRQTIRKLIGSGGPRPITTVVVTHSEDMMRLADRLIMIEDGCVVEEGPYSELSQSGGRFAELLAGGQWMGPTKRPGDDRSGVTQLYSPCLFSRSNSNTS
jgi:ATP-binding cassette, subfamily B (MDR/TAP), member 1